MAEIKDFTPNSNKYKKNEKVVTQTPVNNYTDNKVIEKSGGKKILGALFAGSMNDIKNELIFNIVIPQAKKVSKMMFEAAINTLFYGNSGGNSTSYDDYSKTKYTNYANISNDTRTAYSQRSRTYEYNDICFRSRGDAEAALYDLKMRLKDQGCVTVFDWFEICHKTCDYTARDFGWTNLNNARVGEAYGGWVVIFPKALPIDY